MLPVAVSWLLWSVRIYMIFRSKLILTPLTIPLRIICLLLQWKPLLKPEELPTLETLAGAFVRPSTTFAKKE
ncbi:Os11g0113150 [Oryza sativa Japonica Group]|jgi:hypothetical protein|uniref:Os11g0113150 protein n=1 Tax=Oryza sativa subsp. japonica TaxID=39947 RepID=A0A0N7KSB9_ORYSJ|nr:Os11g0113150 [Oryza sativa Japonica Group]